MMRALLEELDVELIDAHAVQATHPGSIADGWQLKPYAILHSCFQEVLLLDADQVPVRDPAEVFRWPQYLETGALFWPDIVDLACRTMSPGSVAVSRGTATAPPLASRSSARLRIASLL